MEANGGGDWDWLDEIDLEANEDLEWLDDLIAMEANGGGEWMDDGLGMVVLSNGLVAWVPAQAVMENGGRDAMAAAVAQNGWVPAEAAARTRWIPSPGMLVMDGEEAHDVALRHGWLDGLLAMEANAGGESLDDLLAAMEANAGGECLDDQLAMEANGGGERTRAVVRRKGPDNDEAGKASRDNPALYLALLCLPAQEIARCRGFCRYITSTDVFRRHHHDHHFRTPMPLFFFLDPKLRLLNLSAVDVRSRVPRPVLRFARPSNHEVFRVHGSCDGILLLSSGRRLYACNPCTRRWASLLPIHVHHDIIGFYVTPGPGGDFECNVLYHDRMVALACEYWIYTVGTAASVRKRIGRPCPAVVELDPVLAKGIVPSYKIPPVFVRGSLHWPPKAAQDNTNVLTFDIGAEAFSLITPPIIQEGADVVGRQLFEIDERLAMTVISFSQATVDVWVLGDDNAELWSRRYTIHVPVNEIRLNNSCHHNGSVFAVAQDRQCLVQCPRVLLQCDVQGAVLQRYRYQHHDIEYWTALSGHTIQESLLLHPAILPMRGRDAAHGEPPFFRVSIAFPW